jgi:hypothetical protein
LDFVSFINLQIPEIFCKPLFYVIYFRLDGESTGVDESQCHPKYWMLPHSWSTDLDQDGKVLIKPIATVYGDVFAAGCLFFYFLKRGLHPFGDMESILKNIEEKNPANLQSIKFCFKE